MLMPRKINLKISANGRIMVESKTITVAMKINNWKTKQKW